IFDEYITPVARTCRIDPQVPTIPKSFWGKPRSFGSKISVS
ncbi:unnamed protein product, partial [Ixodes persulcatus]